MKPNKLDTKIREKLNAREIQPSAQAWDRLDAMLTVSEEKKPKKRFGWFFVAASTILFFGLGFFLFNSSETTEINNSIPVVNNINEEIDSVETNKTNEVSIENAKPVLVQNEVNSSKKSSKDKQLKSPNEIIKSDNLSQENAAMITYNPTSSINKYISAEKLLASVENKTEANQEISIDRKVAPKNKTKVDANSLLTSVEGELNESFRESAFDRINRNYNVIKSALANRNYE